ncbi:MAG TPA: L-threonylcarbamoyladenylate synthase [Candidatus Pacearchaeota archaeon]|jgi:L-threonylcarbamoyladenylate synthase|nr:Sua5/YciO/YrdC/YwlC family protein [Bacteroidales bacterium]HOF44729.1 L-threonylcarbamoyladenylate synthase [Candidatus Pacearchaeota archaeon]HOS12641.1 L-threonylcarbamoyladenylate synthase [Candidatus Pacearchaeota archaeon]HPL72549.1 L-threonylcarbamoyladenylate synthase [Candidatus Pacearchaeota archaeon]HPX52009.1 L-threonylcarbamoyladenylate synthase [Candidatus Pacearchaeota archaeon]
MDQQIINIIAERIKQGEIGVIPTDTIYGIVCSAFNENSVEKLYKIRKRNKDKPMIILIGSVNDLKLFNIDAIVKNWPEKTSIVFDCNDFEYLHRGKRSLAFRLPHNKDLIDILKISGPIVAPSANIEGGKPAENIKEAKSYFGDKIDFYLDVGTIKSKPSKIIYLNNEIIRE